MAIGTHADLVMYDEEFYGGMSEVLAQNATAFNQASNFALVQDVNLFKGQYEHESFWLEETSLVRRRDSTSTAASTPDNLTQAEQVRPKLDRGIHVEEHYDKFAKLGIPGGNNGEEQQRHMNFVLGQQMGKAILLDQLESLIGSLANGIPSTAAFRVDGSAGTFTFPSFISAKALFGDAGESIVAWVMHSKPYYDLEANQASNVYEMGSSIRIAGDVPGTNGRPVIVTDSSNLVISGAPDTYITLGLTREAAVSSLASEMNWFLGKMPGNVNLRYVMQYEWSHSPKLKGYSWDIANGGANPNDTALFTQTNWDQVATDDKNTAGVKIITQ